MRACSRLNTRRAPIVRAIVFGSQLDEYTWNVPTTGAPASKVHASQPTTGAIGSCTWITSKAPVAQLGAQAQGALGSDRDVRAGSVHGERGGAAQRDDVVGNRGGVRSTPVQRTCEPVVGVDGAQDPYVVAFGEELTRQGVDVARHASGKSPRIRRDQGDPHPGDAINGGRRLRGDAPRSQGSVRPGRALRPGTPR